MIFIQYNYEYYENIIFPPCFKTHIIIYVCSMIWVCDLVAAGGCVQPVTGTAGPGNGPHHVPGPACTPPVLLSPGLENHRSHRPPAVPFSPADQCSRHSTPQQQYHLPV